MHPGELVSINEESMVMVPLEAWTTLLSGRPKPVLRRRTKLHETTAVLKLPGRNGLLLEVTIETHDTPLEDHMAEVDAAVSELRKRCIEPLDPATSS